MLPGASRPCVDDAEISAAKTACDAALKGVAIDYQPLPPIQEGICGTPAPILVKSIGSDPAVAIDPPATMNCALAAGLAKWLEAKVQPEANAVLHTKVVKLRNATSYSCRNRYGGRPRHSASMRSPTQSTSRTSCSPPATTSPCSTAGRASPRRRRRRQRPLPRRRRVTSHR